MTEHLGKRQKEILFKMAKGWTLVHSGADEGTFDNMVYLSPPVSLTQAYINIIHTRTNKIQEKFYLRFLSLKRRGFIELWTDEDVALHVKELKVQEALGTLEDVVNSHHYNEPSVFLNNANFAFKAYYVLTPKAWKWLAQQS